MTEEENNACIFPRCHECNEGYLVPFSFKEDVFEKWKCTKCGHTIGKKD
tara:strand:- start:4160 stop:4306 length:147 start_codon:yes stop_codon:yes gene_type:complete